MADPDFIDIGCSSGGSLAWGARFLGGQGIGVDIDPAKVAKARAAGQEAVVADATRLLYPDNAFRFALFFDMLEHLPGADLALRCVREAYRVSRDFVLIRGPNFDGEAHLRAIGLKRYYTDWSGHTWHHRAGDFQSIIRRLEPVRSLVMAHHQITESADPDLLPLDAPPNQARYNSELHGDKPDVALPGRIFTRLVVVLAKNPEVNVHELALQATGSLLYDTTLDKSARADQPASAT